MKKMLAKGQKLKIAIDTMGGDFAPQEIVKGAIGAASEGKQRLFLLAQKLQLEKS